MYIARLATSSPVHRSQKTYLWSTSHRYPNGAIALAWTNGNGPKRSKKVESSWFWVLVIIEDTFIACYLWMILHLWRTYWWTRFGVIGVPRKLPQQFRVGFRDRPSFIGAVFAISISSNRDFFFVDSCKPLTTNFQDWKLHSPFYSTLYAGWVAPITLCCDWRWKYLW